MKRGYPRPTAKIEKTSRAATETGSYGDRWDGKTYPWPYNASGGTISNIDRGRLVESVLFKKCGTCGEQVEEDLVGLILYDPEHKNISDGSIIHSETGPYHLKCLVLNFTMCPHLVETGEFMPGYGAWKDVYPQILAKIQDRDL